MAPRPDPFSSIIADATDEQERLLASSPTSVLSNAPALFQPQVVVLVDPLSTGVALQQKVFESGLYEVVIVWSDRSQRAAREKHFQTSGHPREDFLAIITHHDALDATLLAILRATSGRSIAAVMCGSEFGVLLEDQIAEGLNKKLGISHLKGSGIANLQTKVDKHMQANTIRSYGLEAVRERVRTLAEAFREQLAGIDGVHVADDGVQKSGIVTFHMDGTAANDVKLALREHAVNVSASELSIARLDLESRNLPSLVRASVHYYNTHDELDRACELIRSL